jgi:hypothetical protein
MELSITEFRRGFLYVQYFIQQQENSWLGKAFLEIFNRVIQQHGNSGGFNFFSSNVESGRDSSDDEKRAICE